MTADPYTITMAAEFRTPGRRKDKYDATVAPTVDDDADARYVVGSVWIDQVADDAYLCLDSSPGAAVWLALSGGVTDLASATLAFWFGPGAAVGHFADIEVPFDCTIVGWTLLAEVSGSVSIDIWADTYANHPPTNADSITASATPSISGATKATSSSLTGWTTALVKGRVLRAQIESLTTIGQPELFVRVLRA